jgi:hypothetical protein
MLEAVQATLNESLGKLKNERDMLDEQIATLESLAGGETVAPGKKRGRKPNKGKKRGPKPGKRGRKPGPKAKNKKRGPKSRKEQSVRMKAYWVNWRKKNKSGKKKVKTAKKTVSKLSDAAKQSIKDITKAKAAVA